MKKHILLFLLACLVFQCFSGCTLMAKEPAPEVTSDIGNKGVKATEEPIMPDPITVVLAVANKEARELVDGISEEGVKLYVSEAEVLTAAMEFKAQAIPERMETALYEVMTEQKADLEEKRELFRICQMLPTAYLNSYGVVITATSSVIRNMNSDNSYNYPWMSDDLPVYVVVESVDGWACAAVVCFFNEYGALETVTFPLPVSGQFSVARQLLYAIIDGDLGWSSSEFEEALEAACEDGRIGNELLEKAESGDEEAILMILDILADWRVPKLRKVSLDGVKTSEYPDILKSLMPAKTQMSAEAVARKLAGAVAQRANEAYLQKTNTPDEMIDLCLSCAAFDTEPARVIRWDASDFDVFSLGSEFGLEDGVLSEDELRMLLAFQLPALLNGNAGVRELAAYSIMTVNTAVSGLTDGDAVFWLCYEDEGSVPFVCSVSVLKNSNDCYDVSAGPIFAQEFTAFLLARTADGPQPMEELMNALVEYHN